MIEFDSRQAQEMLWTLIPQMLGARFEARKIVWEILGPILPLVILIGIIRNPKNISRRILGFALRRLL